MYIFIPKPMMNNLSKPVKGCKAITHTSSTQFLYPSDKSRTKWIGKPVKILPGIRKNKPVTHWCSIYLGNKLMCL